MENDAVRSVPDGLSSAAPIEPLRVSPAPASIPSALADAIFRSGVGASVEMVDRLLRARSKTTRDIARNQSLIAFMNELDELMQLAVDETRKPLGITGYSDAFAESKRINGLAAQAIEARRAETQSGSVHESAVGETDAPNPTPLTEGN